MTTPKTQKKGTTLHDWHPADVVASLRKAGWSLQQLAFHHGYTCRQGFSHALHNPYPKVEALIAEALNTSPTVIWPSRYGQDGKPNRTVGPKPLRPAGIEPATQTCAKPSVRVHKDMPTKVVGNTQAHKVA